MTAILLDPHGDDASLFAAYTCLRFRPLVIVTHRTVPLDETVAGVHWLGCQMTSLVWDDFDGLARHLKTLYGDPDWVYAPHPHPDGHGEHNDVGQLAVDLYGSDRVRQYLTYAPRGERSRYGVQVKATPEAIRWKLASLACYPSQIEQATTRPWFYDLLDMREWVA